MHFTYDNYSYEYFLYDYPTVQNWLQSTTIFLFSITGLLFAKSFLQLSTLFPVLNKLTNTVILGFILLMMSTSFLGYNYHMISAIIFIIVFCIYVFSIALYTYQHGNSSAKFFILGTIFGFFGTSITALNVLEIIPYYWFTYKAIDMGMVIDTILFSIALSNRYTILHNNLELVKDKLKIANVHLEDTVKDRTAALTLEVNNKNILLKEISHRVKNNLQIISSLFSLQSNSIKDTTAKNIIEENIKRIKSIALLHEKLLKSKDLQNISLEEYINSILTGFKETSNHKKIEFTLHITNKTLSSDNLVPLGLIINELIINSIKYAHNDKRKTLNIDININTDKSNMILQYGDNGKDVVMTGIKKGFGSKLLEALVVYQLNGKIDKFNQNGLKYTITFPYTITT